MRAPATGRPRAPSPEDNEGVLALLLLFVFSLSRIGYWLAGVQFTDATLQTGWQILDPFLLTNKLLESSYYLHAQPPGFNLFLGSILKLAGPFQTQAFHACYLACGFVLYWSLFKILRAAGVSQSFSFAISTAYIVSPQAVLYENWLYPTYPVAMLLALASLAFARFVLSASIRMGTLFFLLLLAICLMRSMFHLLFVLAAILLIKFLSTRLSWKSVLIAALPALILLAVLYTKNYLLFGYWSPSSWLGMNLWHMTGSCIGDEERASLIADGELAPISAIRPFEFIASYPDSYQEVPARFEHIETLSAIETRPGARNLNHWGYTLLSRDYGKGAMYGLTHKTRCYLSRVCDAWLLYLSPSTSYFWFSQNARNIVGTKRLSHFWHNGLKISLDGVYVRLFRRHRHQPYPIVSLLLLPSLVLGGSLFSARRFIYRWTGIHLFMPRKALVVVGFCLLTILYVAWVGNSIEFGENNRFRAITNPQFLILAALVTKYVIFNFSRRRSRRLQELSLRSAGTD